MLVNVAAVSYAPAVVRGLDRLSVKCVVRFLSVWVEEGSREGLFGVVGAEDSNVAPS